MTTLTNAPESRGLSHGSARRPISKRQAPQPEDALLQADAERERARRHADSSERLPGA
jgi:hypothetical protein